MATFSSRYAGYNSGTLGEGECAVRQTVYLDVLVAVNFLVDYFLLYSAGQLSGAGVSRVRLCLAAVFGAACSCAILLPPLPLLPRAAITLGSCAVMTLIGFGFSDKRRFVRTFGFVLLVSLCYAGLMLALWLLAAPRGMTVNNGMVYIDLPPGLLVLMAVVCYAALSFASGALRRRNLVRSRCTVTISSSGGSVELEAIIDTGNLLTEPFSGLPVIVAEYERLRPVLPEGFDGASSGGRGLRVIPYSGMGGEGVMLAFLPEHMTAALPGQPAREAEGYVGVLRGGRIGAHCHAIVNPDALL